MARSKKRSGQRRAEAIGPTDFLHFVELDEFRDGWTSLGLDVEEDLLALELAIMNDPTSAPIVRGTGGLRKLRFAPPKWKVGKRGAIRVGYVYFEKHWMVLLVIAYGKNEQDDLTDEERDGIREYIEKCRHWLERRNR